MKHTYKHLPLTPEDANKDYKVKSRQECTTCGLQKETTSWGVYYERSGISFNYSPECIDWELENSKTID